MSAASPSLAPSPGGTPATRCALSGRRHHPGLRLRCRDHPHASPPSLHRHRIPTSASGGHCGPRPSHPHRPHFHGHHPLHLSHCHGVDSHRPRIAEDVHPCSQLLANTGHRDQGSHSRRRPRSAAPKQRLEGHPLLLEPRTPGARAPEAPQPASQSMASGRVTQSCCKTSGGPLSALVSFSSTPQAPADSSHKGLLQGCHGDPGGARWSLRSAWPAGSLSRSPLRPHPREHPGLFLPRVKPPPLPPQ